MKPDITQAIDAILPEVKTIRHHLHTHPELALHEVQTAQFIRTQLAACHIELLPPFLTTDVVGLLSGKSPGKHVALRADMDALPLQEQTGRPYQSVHPNVMHACGHDGHMAMLIGTARVLAKLREGFDGSVKFIFQPGEEIVAAGKELVQNGVLDEPKPDAVLAVHGWPGLPVGVVSSRPGPLLAAADFFTVTIHGKGGHGAAPEKAVDPILIASRIINSLYLIPSRQISALESVVISVCKIQGGSNANIIPDDVVFEGSIRYFSPEIGERLPALFEQAVKTECAYWGAEYQLDYRRPYRPTINTDRIVAVCKGVTEKYVGQACWSDLAEPAMGSEDFSYYLAQYPGAMCLLGMGADSPALHTNTFDFNDDALRQGILFLVLATLELLQ
jgi:amidohydrolase